MGITCIYGVFSKAGFISAPEAREEVAQGETVGFLANEKTAPDRAAESTVIQHSFAPSGGLMSNENPSPAAAPWATI